MPLNLEAQNTHILFDRKGYPVVKDDAESINDTCGRLVLMGMCYGFIPHIVEKLEALLIKQNSKERIIRHPDNPVTSSRDHHSYFYIYRKYTGQELPDFPRMRGMNEWMGALQGLTDSEWWYYFWNIPGAYIGNWWLRTLRKIGNICPIEMDNDWWIGSQIVNGHYLQTHRTPWQKLWGKIIHITIPAYSLHIKAWQIYVMPESKRKANIKRILLKRCGKSNIMLRLLLGDTTVSEIEVSEYPHMTGYRPGAYLNTTNRDIRGMTPQESEFNSYEYDLIQWLWKQWRLKHHKNYNTKVGLFF